MEGAGIGVGYVEFIRADGSKKTIGYTGEVTETSAAPLDFCDKCQEWKSSDFGATYGADGLSMLWYCSDCK
jgi:hypothetical protein